VAPNHASSPATKTNPSSTATTRFLGVEQFAYKAFCAIGVLKEDAIGMRPWLFVSALDALAKWP
jgi:hypothetical protein